MQQIEFEILCSECGKTLSDQSEVTVNNHGVTILVDPCNRCREEARDKGYDSGYKDGKKENETT